MFCILMRLWVELFVWQGLIQAENTVYKKHQLEVNATNLLFIYCIILAQTENLYSLALQENK